MNHTLLDPFQNDFPEVIEEYLEHGITKCISFNRRGTLLAAGCADGSCVIWDFHTRGVTAEFRDPNCSSPVTSVSWSKCGHHLLAAAMDKSLVCWDVSKGEKIATVSLHQTAIHARLHPGMKRPLLCLACPMSSAPLLVDLSTGEKHQLPLSAPAKSPEPSPAAAATATRKLDSKGKGDGSVYSPSAASFNKEGDLIYLGNSKGEVLIIDTESREVRGCVQVPGNAAIRQIVFNRNGGYLLTNSTDRVIRLFENRLPRLNPAAALREAGDEKPEALVLSKEFMDAVNRNNWKTTCFSNDGEFVVGASGNKGEHKIMVWTSFGQFARALECPKEGVMDLAWHPTRPLLASVSMSGLIYLWAKDYTENWSAFAPDFRELEENEEYVEREDEFDLNAETDKVKPFEAEEDIDVDVTTTEKVAVFSDSDESQDNLYFLPTIPQPDSPELEEASQPPGSPGKAQAAAAAAAAASLPADESNESPASEEQKEQQVLGAPQQYSPQEDEVGANGRTKRKRKLSEKAAELQAEIGRKSKTKAAASKGKNTKASGDADSDETQEEEPPLVPKKHSKRIQKLKQVSNIE